MKLRYLLFSLLLIPQYAAAQTETFGNYVNGLPTATSVGTLDKFYVNQSGTSKEVPWSVLSAGITLPLNEFFIGSSLGIATPTSLSGDCTYGGSIVCTKTNGTNFAASATIDTTNASHITSGTLSTLLLPSPFTSGSISGNTSVFATTTGGLISGDCVKIDSHGNFIDSGSACSSGSGLTVGTTTISGGTNTEVLFNNAGVLGNYTNTQLTALINLATASLNGALPAWPNNTTTFFRGDGTYTAVGLSALASESANTWVGNSTGSSASPSANSWTSCSGNNSAVNYTNGTGTGCNTNLANLTITDQDLSGGATVTPFAPSAGNITIDCGKSPLEWISNTGAFTITAPAISVTTSQNCALMVVNGTTASNAGAVTLAGFSGKSPGGATFSTTPTVSAASVSYTNSSANIGWTANGLSLGSIIFLATTGSLPTNFSTATLYYVVTTGTNTIQVSATPGGSAIVAGSAGSGTQTAYVPSVFDLVLIGINGPAYGQWVQIQ